MLKGFVVFYCIVILGINAKNIPTLDFVGTVDGNCAEQNGITYSEIIYLHKTTDHSRKLMCYANCVLDLVGVFRDGIFQHDVAINAMHGAVSETVAKQMAYTCGKDMYNFDSCEISFEIFQCYDRILKQTWDMEMREFNLDFINCLGCSWSSVQ